MSAEEHMMRVALQEAAQAAREEEVPVGALGVYRGDIIARAHNVRERDQDPLAHAEIAIVQAASKQLGSWRLEELTVVVTLEPCPMCMGALLQARVPKLVYGAMDPKAGACGSLYDLSNDDRLNHRIEVTRGVLAEECGQILKQFFQKRR